MQVRVVREPRSSSTNSTRAITMSSPLIFSDGARMLTTVLTSHKAPALSRKPVTVICASRERP
jgi:hypothetical protein